MTTQRVRSAHSLLRLAIAVCILCAGLVAAGLLPWRTPWVASVDIGSEPPFIVEGETATFQSFFLFYEPEVIESRSLRWMSDKGTVTIPSALHMHPLVIDITMCRCLSDRLPSRAELLLNNQPVVTLATDTTWRRYHVLVPPGLSHPDHSLMVELHAPTWQDSSGRLLGLAIDRLVVRHPAPVPLSDAPGVLVVLVGVVGLAWWRRSLLLPVLLGGSWLLVTVVYQPFFLSRPVVATVLAAGLILMWWANNGAATGTGWGAAGRATLLAIIGVWLVLSPQVLGQWIIDDAYISFRYALQLVNGHGLVFNVGERVEGYTNFLWTMIMAGAFLAGGDLPTVAAITTMFLAFVLLALTIRLARHLLPDPWVLAVPSLLAFSSPFLLYTTRGSGMETALFAALILAALLALLNERWTLAGLLAALTMLTRPDGGLLVVAGGCYALWVGWRGAPHRSPSAVIRHALRYSLVFLALFVPYFVWRWSYYGYLLPNTFYVKVGGSSAQLVRGLAYLWHAGTAHLLPFVGSIGAVVGFWFWRTSRQARWPAAVLLCLLTLLFLGYTVAVGGDWVPGVRFVVPVLPLLAILSVWGVAGLAHALPRLAPLSLLLCGGVMAGLIARLPQDANISTHTDIWTQSYAVRRYREVGRWIHDHTPTDTLLATEVIGALPYYADRPTIDILGLADTHIAHLPMETIGTGRPGHEKTDPEYVLRRAPQIIPYKGSGLLWDHPAFKEQYRLTWFHGPEGYAIWLYLRNDTTFSQDTEGE